MKSAEHQCNEVVNEINTLQEHLTGSSPVGDVDDLEASVVDSFFLVVEAVETLRKCLYAEGYDVPKALS